MEPPEILVHVSAPSGASDDARYRAQVEAILAFQAISRRDILRDEGDEVQNSTLSNECRDDQTDGEARLDGLGDSGTDCINVDNAGPPPLDSPASDVRDRREHENLRSLSASKKASPKKAIRLENDSLGTPISVIPDSQPQGPELEYTHIHRDPDADPVDNRTSNPPSKRRRLDISPKSHGSLIPNHPLTTRPSTNANANANTVPEKVTATTTSLAGLNVNPDLNFNLPQTIHPPPPKVSHNPFKTHITPTLSMLTTRLSPSRIYKPLEQSRALHPLERGYWYLTFSISVNPSSTEADSPNPNPNPNIWTASQFSHFWSFLSSFISAEGRAGWGVWCFLDRLEDSPSSGKEGEGREGGGKEGTTTMTTPATTSVALKVYAWGEIACHVYLLLYLSSQRRVRRMGAQWRDAGEEVVVQMP